MKEEKWGAGVKRDLGNGELRPDLKRLLNHAFKEKHVNHEWKDLSNKNDDRIGRVRLRCLHRGCPEVKFI